MSDIRLNVGDVFEDAEEAIDAVQKFADEHWHPLRLSGCRTVAGYNKMVSSNKHLAPGVGYQRLHWECKHHGTFKSKSVGVRPRVRSFACGCPVEVTITYDRKTNKFVATAINLQHQGHEISSAIYKHYNEQRLPRGVDSDHAGLMLKVNGNPSLVTKEMTSRGYSLCSKDVYNMKQRLLKNGRKTIDNLKDMLNVPGINFSIVCDQNTNFQALYIQTDKQRELLQAYGELVELDSTYSTNSMRYPLSTILVEDADGVGQPVAYAVLFREDETSIKGFLKFVKDNNNVEIIRAVVVDKDMAEINAIKCEWPHAKIMLCYFHVMKAIDRKIVSFTSMSSEEKEKCGKLCKDIINARSEEVFLACLEELNSTYDEFSVYFNDCWLPMKETFCRYLLKDVRTLNNRTNNRLERFHQTLKKILGSSRSTLEGLVLNLLSLVEIRTSQTTHRNFLDNQKKGHHQHPMAEYERMFSTYCCNLIKAELDKCANNCYVVTEADQSYTVYSFKSHSTHKVTYPEFQCSCGIPTAMGVLCRHVISVLRYREDSTFQPTLVAQRWTSKPVDQEVTSTESSLTITKRVVAIGKSRAARYTSLSVVTNALVCYAADQSSKDFHFYMTCFEKLSHQIMRGNVKKLNEVLSDLEASQADKSASISDDHSEYGAIGVGVPSTDTQNENMSRTASLDGLLTNVVVPLVPYDLPIGQGFTEVSLDMEVETVEDEDAVEDQSNVETPTDTVTVNFNSVPRSRGRTAVIRQRKFRVGKRAAKMHHGHIAKKSRKRCAVTTTAQPELDSDDMDKLLSHLKTRHPLIGGLQATILGSNGRGGCVPLFEAERQRFVQILNAGDHWVVVSNLLTNNDNTVFVYDSLHHNGINHQVQVQVSSLLRRFDQPDRVSFRLRAVHQQDSSARLCGYYAAAAALSLCSGVDPTGNVNDDEKLVVDIQQRLLTGSTEPISCIVRQGKQIDVKVCNLKKLHCTCQKPSDSAMICCNGCGSWFHQRCVGPIPESAKKNTRVPWFSAVCCANENVRATPSTTEQDRNCKSPARNENLVSEELQTKCSSSARQPISVPNAVGVIYAPIKAFVEPGLWSFLPHEFLDCALVTNREDEQLLREADVEHTIETTIVADYSDDNDMQRRHPVIPLTSVARQIKTGLRPILFNVLIDSFDDHLGNLFELNVCQ